MRPKAFTVRRTTISTILRPPENKAFVEEFRKTYNRYPKVGALYGYATAEYFAKGF